MRATVFAIVAALLPSSVAAQAMDDGCTAPATVSSGLQSLPLGKERMSRRPGQPSGLKDAFGGQGASDPKAMCEMEMEPSQNMSVPDAVQRPLARSCTPMS